MVDKRVKLKESEKNKYQDLSRELNNWNMKVTVIPIVIGDLGTGIGEYGNKRTSDNHPNYSIVEIGQNTKKNPENVRTLILTQTLVRNYQLTPMRKTQKGVTIVMLDFAKELKKDYGT